MENSLVEKPKSLEVPQKWLRRSDIVAQYPIKSSTVWDWAKKGKLTPIKVSTRVTVFLASEVEDLFNQGADNKSSVKQVQEIKTSHKKRKRRITPKTKLIKSNIAQKPLSSEEKVSNYNDSMADYSARIALRRKRRAITSSKQELKQASPKRSLKKDRLKGYVISKFNNKIVKGRKNV